MLEPVLVSEVEGPVYLIVILAFVAGFLALRPGIRGSTHERLAASGIPILYVVGEHDAITPPDMIEMCHRIVAGSRLEVISDSGHSTYLEQAPAFNDAVLRFLQETAASAEPDPFP